MSNNKFSYQALTLTELFLGLSYNILVIVTEALVGLGRFELPTSPLSGVRSNQLSYRPLSRCGAQSALPKFR